MILWLLGLALAAEVEITAPAGPVRPARPAVLEVVAVDDTGVVLSGVHLEAPDGGGTLRAPVEGGPWLWTPPPVPGVVTLRVVGDGVDERVPVPVEAPPAPVWQAPDRVVGSTQRPVRFRLEGDVPPVEALAVSTSEAARVDLHEVEGRIEVEVAPDGGGGARAVVVALRDLRSDTAPELTVLRLVDRPVLSFELEAGARLTVRVGDRSYGPVVSDGQGPVRVPIEQRPGELQAELVVSDDLGNELVTPYVLSARSEPSLVLVPPRPSWPGELPPDVLVVGVRPDGRLWRGADPRCQAVALGDVPVERLEDGVYRVAVPPRPFGAGESRIRCQLGQSVASTRLELPSVPTAIDLRVWPDEVTTDFPVAEVTAHVIDAAGDRLDVDGLRVTADRGTVTIEPGAAGSVRGEYRGGAEAIREGSDAVRARFVPPATNGWPVRVEVSHGSVPRTGAVRVHARARDRRGVPLVGVPLVLRAADATARVVTGVDGWASADLDPGAGVEPVEVAARTVGLEARRVAARGSRSAGPAPGDPDLSASSVVLLTTGRVSSLLVEPDTPVLYLTPGARVIVRVYLYDRAENLVSDELPVLSAEHGSLGPPRLREDGGFDVEYTPPPDGVARTVSIVARASAGSAEAVTRLRLEPRPVVAAIGLSAGTISNLGGITSALFSVDGDVRLPALNGQLVVRLGVGGYTTARESEIDLGIERKRLTLVPVTAAGLVRQDRGRWAGWVGGGVVVAPYAASRTFGDAPAARAAGVLPPGFTGVVGGGRRIGGGELAIELRGTFLSSPGGGTGYTGQVGGLAGVLGYRLVID